MGSGINKDKQVNWESGHFEKSEKAKTLFNSRGTKQGRFHIFDYKGSRGMDRYAVAGEVMKFKTDLDAKLGWWDRKYNVLISRHNENGTTTWYKINKNSLIKRLNPSADLIVDETTGRCSNFEALIAAKAESFIKLKEKSNATTPFEHEFLHQLSGNNHADAYKSIHFIQADDNAFLRNGSGLNMPRDNEANSILVISYSPAKKNEKLTKQAFDKKYKDSLEDLKPFVRVHIDSSQYRKILSGKPISKPIIDAIKDEKLGLPEGWISYYLNGKLLDEKLNFGSDTRPSEIEKFQSIFDHDQVHRIKISIKAGRDEDGVDLSSSTSYMSKIEDVPSIVSSIKSVLEDRF